MDAPWRIELFGWLRATRSDHVIRRFRMQKVGALLAYLAFYHGRSHPRGELIELLWPECDPEVGRHNLRQALFSLRRQLEPPGVPAGAVITGDHASVQLNPVAVITDVAQFEAAVRDANRAVSAAERAQRLTAAVELYRGELLPGHFAAWIVPERQRLAEAYLQALGQLAADGEQAGDSAGSLEWARRAVAADPLREEAHQVLIRLLAAAGQPAAAQRQYQVLERLLQQELGVSPARETRSIVDTIRDRVRRGRSQPVLAISSLPPPSRPVSTCPDLPTGTVTFLLAETVGGTAQDELDGVAFAAARERCWENLRPLFRGYRGHELSPSGEVLTMAFGRASDALAAALAGQKAAAGGDWPGFNQDGSEPGSERAQPAPRCGLRMALHTGEVEPGQEPQRSRALPESIRLLLAAHPGQILLSEKSAGLLRDELQPGVQLIGLGLYRLHQRASPERLFQAWAPDIGNAAFPPPHAPPAHVGRLPLQFTRFFGRETEIAQICLLLREEQTRLLTLTGPGGSGKTRLALEVARAVQELWQGAVWFVPLADLSDSRLIVDRALDALNLRRSPHVPALDQVVACLSGQRALLLLDNLEHLVSEGSFLVQSLLERVPELTCLVTSRQRLSLPAEREFPVGPLAVPGVGCPAPLRGSGGSGVGGEKPVSTDPRYPTPDTLIGCASVELFLDRAKAIRPDFALTRDNAPAVAALCGRLEGLPLAVELAAARIGVLTPAQTLARLDQRFELLTSRQRGAELRHRSLRATLDWSYQLLPADLQRFFPRLTGFRGGWTLEAAEAVCDEPRALEFLEQLRECSMIQAEEGAGERMVQMRFRMLETLREYGAEQLTPEAREALARRHAAYYLALAEQAEPKLTTGEREVWLDRLDREQDNLRAVFAWSLEPPQAVAGETPGAAGTGPTERAVTDAPLEIGLRLAGALAWFWFYRSYLSEGREWTGTLLARACESGLPPASHESYPESGGTPEEPPVVGPADRGGAAATARGLRLQAKALYAAGLLAWDQGDLPSARSLLEKSAALWRELRDKRALAYSVAWLGVVANHQGEGSRARVHHEESVKCFREVGDPWGLALATGWLGWRQDSDTAKRWHYEESIRLFRELGDPWGLALPLGFMGQLAFQSGHYAEARALFEEALELRRSVGHRFSIGFTLVSLAQTFLSLGDCRRAAELLHESTALNREIGCRLNMAGALGLLGQVMRCDGNYAAARPVLEESLAVWRDMGHRQGTARLLAQLGDVAACQGDRREAAALFGESLGLYRELEHWYGITQCLEGLAGLAAAQGQPQRAVRLLGAVEALREANGIVVPPVEHPDYERLVAAVRSALGKEAYTAGWIRGRAMTVEQALAAASEPLPELT